MLRTVRFFYCHMVESFWEKIARCPICIIKFANVNLFPATVSDTSVGGFVLRACGSSVLVFVILVSPHYWALRFGISSSAVLEKRSFLNIDHILKCHLAVALQIEFRFSTSLRGSWIRVGRAVAVRSAARCTILINYQWNTLSASPGHRALFQQLSQ